MQGVIKILEFEVYLMEGVDSPISDPSIFFAPFQRCFHFSSLQFPEFLFLLNTDDVVKERDVF